MKQISTILLILVFIGLNVATANDTVYIEKNQPAPFSGILFTTSKAKQLRSELLDSDKTKLELQNEQFKSKGLGQIIDLKNSEIELYKEQNARLMKREETSNTMNYIWFGLGILVTGIAVYGAGGLAR